MNFLRGNEMGGAGTEAIVPKINTLVTNEGSFAARSVQVVTPSRLSDTKVVNYYVISPDRDR